MIICNSLDLTDIDFKKCELTRKKCVHFKKWKSLKENPYQDFFPITISQCKVYQKWKRNNGK